MKNTPGGLHITTFEPCGVVAAITPWNYPLVNVVMQVAPALAAGNAVVVKPAEQTPLTTVVLAELAVEAGLPPGVLNVALGLGPEVGEQLVLHPKVKKVAFVGSTEVGQRVQELAARQMKPVNLECGGKNAIVVFADEAEAVEIANGVRYGLSGSVWTSDAERTGKDYSSLAVESYQQVAREAMKRFERLQMVGTTLRTARSGLLNDWPVEKAFTHTKDPARQPPQARPTRSGPFACA